MKREIGYYWVKVPEHYDGEIHWEVAYNTGKEYYTLELCGQDGGFDEDFFIEIGEKINSPQ